MTFAACKFCHGENYAGGQIRDADPGSQPAANLTPAGDLADWSETDFITTLRTGVMPSGETLDNEFMPWKVFGNMSDEDLGSIFMYLEKLPPSEPNS